MKALILDSTLREGIQAPGISFTPEQALRLASELDTLGVDFIELAPLVSQNTREMSKRIIDSKPRAKIILHARATKQDIDALLSLDPEWIATYMSVSDIHLEKKLKINRETAKQRAVEAIEYAKSHGLHVRFTCEDATRADKSYLIEMVNQAENLGTERVAIPDTVGIATPRSFYNLIRDLSCAAPKIEFDVHCHNDFGLALANSIAGLEAGASCVHATINGIGERAGITKLAEIAMVLNVINKEREDLKIERLPVLSSLLSDFTHIQCDPFTPIVGENVFRHKGGTHILGVLNSNGVAYEPFSPTSLNRKRKIVVGEFSGRTLLRYLSSELGLGLTEQQIEKTISRLKEKEGDLFEFEF
ncbi:MAG: hypothetical protein QXW70_00025 [Candidatus Anstonellales archaeon]